MRPPVRLLLLGLAVAALVTVGLVGLGTVLGEEDAPASTGRDAFRATDLEDLDTESLVVPRRAFCDAIDPRQVEAALGAEPDAERQWENGDRIELPSGERDVVHEFGCEYVADGVTASAWVFAPPVEVGRARRLVEELASTGSARCTVLDPAFGQPSTGLSCLAGTGSTTTYAGLFGDAWLACELESTEPDLDPTDFADHSGRWCAGVLLAASGVALGTG